MSRTINLSTTRNTPETVIKPQGVLNFLGCSQVLFYD
jgi:hypothetical protein